MDLDSDEVRMLIKIVNKPKLWQGFQLGQLHITWDVFPFPLGRVDFTLVELSHVAGMIRLPSVAVGDRKENAFSLMIATSTRW